jgi:hypothetical protein
MKRHNQLISPTVAAARASYEKDGLCYTCGMPNAHCLHVTIRHMMSEQEYQARRVDAMTYDQLRDLRLELANALEAARPGRGDVRIHLGRGTDSLPPDPPVGIRVALAYGTGDLTEVEQQDMECQSVVDWLELGESPTEIRSQLLGF